MRTASTTCEQNPPAHTRLGGHVSQRDRVPKVFRYSPHFACPKYVRVYFACLFRSRQNRARLSVLL